MPEPPPLMAVFLDPDMTRDQIVATMRRMRNHRIAFPGASILCSIGGYDHDPRELWQIPQVQDFAIRLVELGFPAYLDFLPDRDDHTGRPFAAVDLWLIACAQAGYHVELKTQEFRQAMQKCFAVAEELLAKETG